MLRSFKVVLRFFLEPGPAPGLFLLGTLLLGAAGNALYDVLKTVFSGAISVLIISLFVLALIVLIVAARQLLRPHVVMTKIEPARALIVLVSQGELDSIPASESIKFHYSPEAQEHKLEFCWLLRTPAPPKDSTTYGVSSWMNAQKLEEQYLGEIKMFPKNVEMDNPESVSTAVRQAVQEARKLKLKNNEIVADVTGGTKIMSIGMALAGIAAGIDLTYLKARKMLLDGRADLKTGSDPVRVDINYFQEKAGED